MRRENRSIDFANRDGKAALNERLHSNDVLAVHVTARAVFRHQNDLSSADATRTPLLKVRLRLPCLPWLQQVSLLPQSTFQQSWPQAQS